MAGETENTVVVRQIQGLAALLSALPPGGKTRELFTLALAVDNEPVLDKLKAPANPDTFDGIEDWLHSHWGPDSVTPQEQEIVDWQNDADNMEGAVGEWKAIGAKVGAA